MSKSFNEWVKTAEITNDPEGDFIGDMQSLIIPPPLFTSKSQVLRHIKSYGACSGAIDALEGVWARYQKFIKDDK